MATILKRSCLSAAVVASLAGAAGAQYTANGVDFLSQINLTQFGVPAGNGNSCWGYVSPSGREYALMGLNNRVTVVEITNPAAPVIRATVSHTDSLWADIKVHGTYAYVTNESGGGLQVINLANIDSGTATFVRNVTSNGMNTAHTCAVDNVSAYVYVTGSSVTGSNGGLVAFSLADPSNPVYAGRWSNHYVHEAQVVTYTSGPYAGKQIAFLHIEGAGLAVVDVTNKASMVTLATRTYPGVSYCHQGWLSEDRQHFYINDELDGPSTGVDYAFTRMFNVSNLSNPVFLGGFSGAVTGAIDHNLYVRGNYIYESNYTSGLRIFDASNPTAPTEVAYIDTHPENDAPEFEGTWNNYPFFPSQNIIISDINRGLFVVRLNSLVFSYPNGTPTQLPQNTPVPVTVSIASHGPGSLVDSSVTLNVKIDSGSYQAIPMTETVEDTFVANIPAAPCLSDISYYVSASNTLGTTFTDPPGSPANARTAKVFDTQQNLFSYDMETLAGWTGSATGDTATTGRWERGDPEASGAQPEDDHTPNPGVNCWVTGRTYGGSIGANDVDSGKTTLVSPTFSLLGADTATRIGYWRWYNNSAGSGPNEDTFRVDISSNNGTNWTSVEVVGPSGPETGGGWFYHDFRVADKASLTANMKMRFIAEDIINGSIVEALVDDVSVYTYACNEVCPSIANQPDDVLVNPGQDAVFVVSATGSATLTYQWRKDGSDLSDGGGISGATTDTLTVAAAVLADEGFYDCVVTNGCGSTTTDAAELDVNCRADYNNDGTLDAFDYDDFVSAYFDYVNNAVGFPDYNNDGYVDAFDYDDFVSEYFAGC